MNESTEDDTAIAGAQDTDAADLAVLRDAVREAGALALASFGRDISSRRKPDGTQVSEADLAVDALLRERLQGARPGYGSLSEETEDAPARLDAERVWVVDPIDGTRAFLKGRPEWTVSVALVAGGRARAAVVFNPVTDEFFDARLGAGAHLAGRPIAVSDRHNIQDSRLVVHERLLKRKTWSPPWPPIERMWVNSTAYRLCLLAAGRCDGVIMMARKADWDLAAADLLVQEAGGLVTNHRGARLDYAGPEPFQPSVVAAGRNLHPALIARTQKAEI